jgi:hypothetical protein
MSTKWLNEKLQAASGVTLSSHPVLLIVSFSNKIERIYCPMPSEYKITADVVEKSHGFGATIIAYGSWCGPTIEGKLYAKAKGISIMPYAGLFAYMGRKGVKIPN